MIRYSSFTQMPVWRSALDLSVIIFELSSKLPRSEDYGLTSQIRRAANSVNANIAEGFGRNTSRDKSHFYIMARGSAYETQNHLIYGHKVLYFDKDKITELYNKYNELIIGLNKIIKCIGSPCQFSKT